MVKPLRDRSHLEVAELAKLPVQKRVEFVLDEFDEWLAVHVLRLKFQHADLSLLNDAFRDYFAGMRSARSPGESS